MFKRTTLSSGLRIVTIPHRDTKTVAVLVLVGTGSKYEEKSKNGISHFLEHMFFKGTKKRPTPIEVTEPIDRVGGIFNAFTSYDNTGYFIKVEYEHIDLALDIVSDIFLNSIFVPKEIEREKGVVVEEINIYRDNPMRRVEDLWQELLYGNQPAGWPITGTRETVSNLSRQDLISYMRSQYVPPHTVVVVAGKIDGDKAVKQISRVFSPMRASPFRDRQKVVERQSKPQALLEYKQTDQTRIALGVRAYPLLHPARFAQEVLAALLGGMFSSRLCMEVREKLGISYDVRTASWSDPDTGYLISTAGIPHHKAETAIKTILKEYGKMTRTKVSPGELKKARDHLDGIMALSLEASEAKASFYGLQELLERRMLTQEQIHDRIKAVSAEDLRRTARDVFVREKLNLVVLGPFKERKQFEHICHF